MTYQQALQYIHSKDRFGMHPGLERITALLHRLGDPQERIPVLHIAGTNGKGSTCAMLASGLSASGYKTGLYTSPFVQDFRERMQIDGEWIPEAELAALADEIAPLDRALADEGLVLTEFELVTAMAFVWFARREVDFLVCEVGLGGRFDATNVIQKPMVSVITTIDLDHTAVLGGTIAEIAREKCGIIKEGCPVISTDAQPIEALDVIAHTCEIKHAPFSIPDTDKAHVLHADLTGTTVEFFGRQVVIPFCGERQISNGMTALAVAFTMRNRYGVGFRNEDFLEGMKRARLPARQELLRAEPPVLLDGAHNPGGVEALAGTVERFLPRENCLLVIGMMADKDTEACLRRLAPLFSRVVTVPVANPRAASPEALRAQAAPWCADVTAAASLDEGLAVLGRHVAAGGAAVVAGSLYLAGEARGKLLALLGSPA